MPSGHDMTGHSERANSYRDVSDRTTLSIRSVQRLVKAGRLAAVRIGGRVLIPEAEVRRLLEQGTSQPNT